MVLENPLLRAAVTSNIEYISSRPTRRIVQLANVAPLTTMDAESRMSGILASQSIYGLPHLIT